MTPSSKGRQRKKNSKYFDYETKDSLNVQSAQQKTQRKSARGRGGAAAKKSPAKSGKANNATQKTEDEEIEVTDKTPQDSDGRKTPKKTGRPKKTPTKKTPARKTPAKKTPTTDGGLPTGEGGVLDTVQQENGTPKRKYVRKRPAQEVEPATEPPRKEAQGEPQIEAEEENQPGGRPRRGAAKA